MGGDCEQVILIHPVTKFQSTPPMWVVTLIALGFLPCFINISIHTTHVGGDLYVLNCMLYFVKFQSTPPMWVVTETPSATLLGR